MTQQLTPQQEQELKQILELAKLVEAECKEGYAKSLEFHRKIVQDIAQAKSR